MQHKCTQMLKTIRITNQKIQYNTVLEVNVGCVFCVFCLLCLYRNRMTYCFVAGLSEQEGVHLLSPGGGQQYPW